VAVKKKVSTCKPREEKLAEIKKNREVQEVLEEIKKLSYKPLDLSKPQLPNPATVLNQLVRRIIDLISLRQRNLTTGALVSNYLALPETYDGVFFGLLEDIRALLNTFANPPVNPQDMLKECAKAWILHDTTDLWALMQLIQAQVENPRKTTPTPKEPNEPVTKLCAEYGVPRTTAHSWIENNFEDSERTQDELTNEIIVSRKWFEKMVEQWKRRKARQE